MAGMDAMEWPPEARELLDRAAVHETPCGDGTMVWHTWGAGAPLVMLHGGSGSWAHWLRNIGTVVAAGRMACVPDLPGFGELFRMLSFQEIGTAAWLSRAGAGVALGRVVVYLTGSPKAVDLALTGVLLPELRHLLQLLARL